MNFDIYTERARGFVQAAQNLAMREGHPQLQPGHLLKVLLDDPEGLCAGLIDRAGGQSRSRWRRPISGWRNSRRYPATRPPRRRRAS